MGFTWEKMLRQNRTKNRHISDNSLVKISLFHTPIKNFIYIITLPYTLQHLKTKTKTQHKKYHNPVKSDIYEQKFTTLDTASKHKHKQKQLL
jgi:hypothetical protein